MCTGWCQLCSGVVLLDGHTMRSPTHQVPQTLAPGGRVPRLSGWPAPEVAGAVSQPASRCCKWWLRKLAVGAGAARGLGPPASACPTPGASEWGPRLEPRPPGWPPLPTLSRASLALHFHIILVTFLPTRPEAFLLCLRCSRFPGGPGGPGGLGAAGAGEGGHRYVGAGVLGSGARRHGGQEQVPPGRGLAAGRGGGRGGSSARGARSWTPHRRPWSGSSGRARPAGDSGCGLGGRRVFPA